MAAVKIEAYAYRYICYSSIFVKIKLENKISICE